MNNKEETLHRLQEDIRLRGLSQNTLESYTLLLKLCKKLTRTPIIDLPSPNCGVGHLSRASPLQVIA